MSGTEERVDIIVTDKVSEEPTKKIIALGRAARTTHDALKDLRTMLDGINTASVRKLQQEMLGQTTATVKQASALATLEAAQARTAAAQTKLEAAQSKATAAAMQAAVVNQRLVTAEENTARAVIQTAIAKERLESATQRNIRNMQNEGAAADKLTQQIEKARSAQNAANAQQAFNTQLGVGPPATGSARASMGVFVQDARDKAAAAAATADLERRVVALKSATDPMYAAQMSYNRSVAEAKALLTAGAISEAEYARAVTVATTALNIHNNAQMRTADLTKLTRFQMLTLQYTINDVAASLASGASPFTILMQQGGQVTQAWGGLTNTLRALSAAVFTFTGLIVGTVAALAGWGVVMDLSRRELADIDRQLALTGGSAGLTAGQFLVMADGIASATHQTVGAAKEQALAWAGTGRVQAQQVEELTAASLNFAVLSKQSNEVVFKSWEKLIEQPAKFTSAFMQQYGVFSSSEYAHIKLLQDTGKETEAMEAVSHKLYEYYGKEAPRHLGVLASAWGFVKLAIAGVIEGMKRLASGDDLPVQQQLMAASKTLEMLQKQYAKNGNADTDRAKAELATAQGRVDSLKEAIRLEGRVTGERAIQQQMEKDGAAAVDYFNGLKAKTLDSQTKLNAKIAEYDKAMSDAKDAGTQVLGTTGKMVLLYDQMAASRNAAIKGFTKELMPDATKQAKDYERLELAVEKVFGNLNKEADGLGVLNLERDKANKLADIEISLASKKFALNAEQRQDVMDMIDDIENAKKSNKALNAVREEALNPMEEYKNKLMAIRALLNAGIITEDQASRATVKNTEAMKNAVDPLYEINRQLEQEDRLLGLVGDKKAVEAKLIQYENTLRAKGIDLNAAEKAGTKQSLADITKSNIERTRVASALESYYNSTIGATIDLTAKQEALTEAYHRGYVGLTEYTMGIVDLKAQLAQIKIDQGEGNFSDILLVSFQKNLKGMEDALVQFTMTGKLDVKSMVTQMIAEFMRLAVVRPFMATLLQGLGFGGGGGVGGVGGVAGIMQAAGGSAGGGASSLFTNGSALYNTYQVGSQVLSGGMSYANGAGTLYANATHTGLDGLLSTNGAYGTAAEGIAGVGSAYAGGGAFAAGGAAEGAFGVGAGATGAADLAAGGIAAEGAGGAAAAGLGAIPVVGWIALAALALYSLSGSHGETRSGGQYAGTNFLEGPSGGEINGDATRKAITASTTSANEMLKTLGSTLRITEIDSGLESSKNGKGFVYAGAQLSNGQYIGETHEQGRTNRRGSKTPEQAATEFGEELKQITLQTLQASNVKGILGDYLRSLGDINALTGGALSTAYEKVTKAISERGQLQAHWDDMTMTSLQKLNKHRADEREALDESNRAMVDRIYALEDEYTIQQNVLNIIDKAKQSAAASADFVAGVNRNIQQYIDTLNATPSGMLSPEDQLKNARTNFDTQLQLANAGDKTALSGITGYADQLIQAQTQWSATGGETQTTLSYIKDSLAALPEMKTASELIVDAINAQTDAYSVTAEQLQLVLVSQFGTLDTTMDGKLSFDELKEGLGMVASDTTLHALITSVDTNGDGQISAIEALAHGMLLSAAQIAQVLDQEFTALDANMNGLLGFDELKAVFGNVADDTTLQQLIAAVDTNGDGAISRLEAVNASVLATAQGIIGATQASASVIANTVVSGVVSAPTEGTFYSDGTSLSGTNMPGGMATGGDWPGGLRWVGEEGPELEYTGPSRIYSTAQSAAMVNAGSDVVAKSVDELREMFDNFMHVMAFAQQQQIEKLDAIADNTSEIGGHVLLQKAKA